jgi:MFS family permease
MLSARPGATPAVDVRTFIDAQPVSGYQWMVTALCGLIVFVDGFDAQAMGFVAPALTADLQVSRAVLGSVISSGLVGMMVGALAARPARRSDRSQTGADCIHADLRRGLAADRHREHGRRAEPVFAC